MNSTDLNRLNKKISWRSISTQSKFGSPRKLPKKLEESSEKDTYKMQDGIAGLDATEGVALVRPRNEADYVREEVTPSFEVNEILLRARDIYRNFLQTGVVDSAISSGKGFIYQPTRPGQGAGKHELPNSQKRDKTPYEGRDPVEMAKERLSLAVRRGLAVRQRSFKIDNAIKIDPSQHQFTLLGQFNPQDPKSTPALNTAIGDLHYGSIATTPLGGGQDPSNFKSINNFKANYVRKSQIDWLKAIQDNFEGVAAFQTPQTIAKCNNVTTNSEGLEEICSAQTVLDPTRGTQKAKCGRCGSSNLETFTANHTVEVYKIKTGNGGYIIVGPDGFHENSGAALYNFDAKSGTFSSVSDKDLDFPRNTLFAVHKILSENNAIPQPTAEDRAKYGLPFETSDFTAEDARRYRGDEYDLWRQGLIDSKGNLIQPKTTSVKKKN